MSKSELVKHLDSVQSKVTAILKPLGFRKKGRAYNRHTEGGLYHVVSLQMGGYSLVEHYTIAGERENLYGKFTVNLGVLLPYVYETERQLKVPAFAQEYDCTIRGRLSENRMGTDEWFELSGDVTRLGVHIVGLLEQIALPFFRPFQSYFDVIAYFDSNGNLPFQNAERAALETAVVAHHLGDAHRAASLFATALNTDHLGFRQYVATIARRLGYNLA